MLVYYLGIIIIIIILINKSTKEPWYKVQIPERRGRIRYIPNRIVPNCQLRDLGS